MSRKPKPDLNRFAAELELMAARAEGLRTEVNHLALDAARLAGETAAYFVNIREVLAEVREARIRGLL